MTIDRGMIGVPLLRGADGGSTIDVEFFRLPKAKSAPEGVPPIFILKGGPGFESAREDLEDPGYIEYFLQSYQGMADVIIPGQRGFGSSFDTSCKDTERLSLNIAKDQRKRAEHFIEGLKACKARWEKEGIDLNGFNALEAARDVIDIARALNYEKIQLVGNSFGSHWAMAILREDPELIERATLSGMEGPNHTYDIPSHQLAALRRISKSVESSSAFKDIIPKEGLLASYEQVIQRADQNPITIDVEDPETGESVSVDLVAKSFRELARGYSGSLAFRHRMYSWPLDILNLLEGNYTEAAKEIAWEWTDNEIEPLAYYHYDCGSGIDSNRKDQILNDPALAVIGNTQEYYFASCPHWEIDLGDSYRKNFETSVPTLIVHGDWDMNTPIENAKELLPFFKDSKFVRVEGGSHGAMREAQEDIPGFRDQVYDWIKTGDYSGLPDDLILPPLDWKAP